jgi:hypothetical protein
MASNGAITAENKLVYNIDLNHLIYERVWEENKTEVHMKIMASLALSSKCSAVVLSSSAVILKYMEKKHSESELSENI